MTTAAIYVRISADREGKALGVERQEEQCRLLAARLGLQVVTVFSDNDISASRHSRKVRPRYQQMLSEARRHSFATIVAATSSRLTRRPRELEDLLDLFDEAGTTFEYVKSPRYDLKTAAGRKFARYAAADDASESDEISERVIDTLDQRRTAGKPHGGHRPYGWEMNRMEIRESEAAVIRESAGRLLAGEPIRSVIRDLNTRGLFTSTGKEWTHPTFRKMIIQARHAGIVTHYGQEIGKGTWPEIIAPETWRALVRTLSDPARVMTPGRGGQLHMLSGIAKCGVCGSSLRVGHSKAYKAYRCMVNACVSRRRDYLEEYVTEVIIGRLSLPNAAALLAAGDDGGARERAAQEAERVRHRLDEAAVSYASGLLTMRQLETINGTLRPELAALEVASTPPPDRSAALGSLIGAPDVRAAWEALSPDARRTVVRLLLTITVHRAKRGNTFTTEGIDLQWC